MVIVCIIIIFHEYPLKVLSLLVPADSADFRGFLSAIISAISGKTLSDNNLGRFADTHIIFSKISYFKILKSYNTAGRSYPHPEPSQSEAVQHGHHQTEREGNKQPVAQVGVEPGEVGEVFLNKVLEVFHTFI
jgi:hypothetical protein